MNGDIRLDGSTLQIRQPNGFVELTFPLSGTVLTDASGIATITGDEAGNATLNIQADESDDTADRWGLTALAASATLEIANAASTSKTALSAGAITVTGAEAGDATLNLYADESDDTADRWSIAALAASTGLRISNASTTAIFTATAGGLDISAAEAGDATLTLTADEGDNTVDIWTITSDAANNRLTFANAGGQTVYFDQNGVVTAAGGLAAGTITPDTKFCTTEFVAVTGTTGTTLTNIVGLTGFAVAAAGIYEVEIFINGVATANCGHKIGLKLTTATLTSANYGALALLASTMAYTQGTTATDQMSLHAATTATLGVVIRARIIVNAAGTIAVQAAQNAAHADETKVYVGSWARLTRIS